IHLGIVDRYLVVDRVLVHPRETLDHMERFALRNAADAPGSRTGGDGPLVVVVRRLDDQRVAFPASAWIAVPQADIPADVRTSVHRDDAGLVNHLVRNHHEAGTLDDLVRVVVPGREHAGGHPARDTANPGGLVHVRIAE